MVASTVFFIFVLKLKTTTMIKEGKAKFICYTKGQLNPEIHQETFFYLNDHDAVLKILFILEKYVLLYDKVKYFSIIPTLYSWQFEKVTLCKK